MSGMGMHLSKEFFEVLKAIGESKSKQEEDRIMQREIATLKQKMEAPAPSRTAAGAVEHLLVSTKKRAGEFLVRLLYIEMLGHDASFGYIKALELAASSSASLKKTGYLLCAACLSPHHDFRFMLVNQMQRDLSSSSVVDNCAALIAVTSLITSEMVPAMVHDVMKLMEHSSDSVRKKAIMALHRFHQLAPEVVTKSDMCEKLRKVLCDKDPAVMGAALNCIESMARGDVKPFKDLVPSLVSILKQILESRLPSEFDYHRVPAPWMQMKIVRILSILGKGDANASNGIYEILHNCIRKADGSINAGNAIIHECVRTITVIYPNPTLLDAAAEAISRFILSKSANLRYLGVTGLAEIVESHPQYAAAHQMAVIECLEDRDETLKRRTLDLLYKMTNSGNVQFITEKMLQFLRNTMDNFLKKSLTAKVCSLAEKYAPNNIWYIDTITQVFEISGNMVAPEVSQNMMTLIAEGAGEEDDEADLILRQHAVQLYTLLLDKPYAKLPSALIETIAWVLGEYAYLSGDFSIDEILMKLCTLTRKGKSLSPQTRKIVVTAIMKLVAQAGTCPPHAAKVIDDFTKSQDLDLQQRCLEFQTMLTSVPHILGDVLPIDASCEDIQVDINLSFLDGFVRNAISSGARVYDKPDDDDDDDDYDLSSREQSKPNAFKMTPYAKPTTTPGSMGQMKGLGSGPSSTVPAMTSLPPGGFGMNENPPPQPLAATPVAPSSEPQLVLRNVASVWGKTNPVTPAPAPVVPSPLPPTNSWSQLPIQTPSTFVPSTPTPPIEPVKTEEQLRKERMAAALFGGAGAATVVTNTSGFTSSSAAKRPIGRTAISSQSVSVNQSAPLTSSSAIPSALPSSTVPSTIATAPAPAAVVEMDLLGFDSPPPTTAPVDSISRPISSSLGPFAASGLFGDLNDVVSNPFMNKSPFIYLGSKMVPLSITTAEFGQRWGSCAHTHPTSIKSKKVTNLDEFMQLCESIGAYKVEAIGATHEGISAGMISGSVVTLIHGKVSTTGEGGKVDITIKSNDANIGGILAMHLQAVSR